MAQHPRPLSPGDDEYLMVAEAAARGAWRIRPADLEAWLFGDDRAEAG